MRNLQRILATLCLGAAAWGYPVRHPSLKIRLISPLTSYDSVKGTEFRSVVIAPYLREGEVILPQGTIIHGIVEKSRHVGLGVVHERATMELAFQEYQLPDGRRFPFSARLRRVDNARETVNSRGQIQGILAANNPQSLIQGIWHRPRLDLFSRSYIGLTGAVGRIVSDYSMGPVGIAALFAIRIAMFRLPEPEIQLPVGTELSLSVTALPEAAPTFPVISPEALPADLEAWLSSQPVEVTKPGGGQSADIINLAFVGSKEELARAFRAAGWFEAEPKTARTLSRTYNSYAGQTGYPSAPVSKLLYGTIEPDATFQKSFNTISKRHHIRVWRVGGNSRSAAQEIWLGAATHDIGIDFNRGGMTFSHKIDRRIDLEREKVVNDLVFANCAERAQMVERPAAARTGQTTKEIVTDGRLSVLLLREACADSSDGAHPVTPNPPKSKLARVARRMMLEGRQYALRGNAYYWAYRALTFNRTPKDQAHALVE